MKVTGYCAVCVSRVPVAELRTCRGTGCCNRDIEPSVVYNPKQVTR